MLKNIYKYFFFLIISFILLILIVIIVNSEIRRKSLNYLINGYKVYMIVSLQSELKKDQPDFLLINGRLNKYLDRSNQFANGKSKLLIGIYDAAKIVQARIINSNDYGKLEEFYKNLVKNDPLMYEAKIWYAQSLYANNKISLALEQINKAIKISPVDHEHYRLGIEIASRENLDLLLNKYCNAYFKSEFGGKQKRYSGNFFTGFNINKFGLQFANKKSFSKIYTLSGINLNSMEEYEFIPEKPINADNIKLFFSFVPGISINFEELVIFHNNKIEKLEISKLNVFSKNSFFLDNLLIFSKEEDEIISFFLNDEYKNIEKILLRFEVKKLIFSNKCRTQ